MIRTATLIRVLGAVAVIAIVLFLIMFLGHLVRLLVLAFLVAYLLAPSVRMIESRGVSRSVATAAIFGFVCLLLVAFVFWCLPYASAQVDAFEQGHALENLRDLLRRFDKGLNQWLADAGLARVSLVDSVEQTTASALDDVVSRIPDLFGFVADLFLVPFIAFFMLKDGPSMKKQFVSVVPNRYFEFTLIVLHKIDRQLGDYLRGLAIAALTVGVLATLALLAIGEDYYVLVGAFAGVTNLVPYVGPVAGAALAVSVWVVTKGTVGGVFAILAAFSLIQVIDNVMVQPLVLSRKVSMPPLAILLAVIVGGTVFGFIGLVLAVPATATAKVVISEVYRTVKRYRLVV